MDGTIEGPLSESQRQTISQQNEKKEEEPKSRQKSRRKWWKMSRNEKEEKTQKYEKNMGCCEVLLSSELISSTNTDLDGNVVNGIRTVKGTSESVDFPFKFSVNKKPSLDPLDVNNVKKHEKKKKRKDKKTAANESSDIYKKSGKSKSASTHSPRSQNPLQRSEGLRETSVSPTDSEFWGFSNSRSPLNFNVEHALDMNTIVDRPVDNAATTSDDEYEAEMAYRFPFLYKRLSIQQPQNTGHRDLRHPERHVTTPKPPRQTLENLTADDIKKPFKMKSPDLVCNRRNVYIIDKDTNRSTPVFTCRQGNVKESDLHAVAKNKNIATISYSTVDKDKNMATISRGIIHVDKDKTTASVSHVIVDKDKTTATVSHSNATGSKVNIPDTDKNMATINHSNVQEVDKHMENQDTNKYTATSDESRKGRRVQIIDNLSSDIDKLLDELDEIW
ncbi:hypothetical protein KP79_PYT11723 [Mizuhopecten yessoensis]|uniref:Uncharacterized protein n=1 Tax=Mizuhopecten yessoensis TaxID=6573 RepID=A0A210QSD9_MIZYE|nr:hypothetical protein KP79_PYT11723 [Mizuhopecten yessoensis]